MDIDFLQLIGEVSQTAGETVGADLTRVPSVVEAGRRIRELRQQLGGGDSGESAKQIASRIVAAAGATAAVAWTNQSVAGCAIPQLAAKHRKTFRVLATLCALANGMDDRNYHNNPSASANYKKRKRSPSPVRLGTSMSDEDRKIMPEDAQAALTDLLMRADASPLAVLLLSAFPPTFVSSNTALHARILDILQQHPCTSTELFSMIQPPYYVLNPTDIPDHIVKAIVCLIEAGEMQIVPLLKKESIVASAIMASINTDWHTAIVQMEADFDSKVGTVGFDSLLGNVYSLSKIMQASKSVLKIAIQCGFPVLSSDGQYKAVKFIAKLATVKWLLIEIVKFFGSIPINELDADSFLEGPLPLLPNIVLDLDPSYQQLALKLAAQWLLSKMATFPAWILDKILELLLSPFGFDSVSSGDVWKWVHSTRTYLTEAAVKSGNDSGSASTESDIALVSTESDSAPGLTESASARGDEKGDKGESAETNPDNVNPTSETTNKDAPRQYYTSPIEPVFVADINALQDALATSNCVALDCEWRPDSFNLEGERDSPAATLQIAISSFDSEAGRFGVVQCFVLGLLEIDEQDFVRVVGGMFANKEILKLGFGFSEDLQRLLLRFPSLQSVLDMQNLADLSSITPPQKARHLFGNKKKISLNDLTWRYLGLNMEKRIRLSDWERRPLTRRQLVYAANDTLALMDVYVEMRRLGDLAVVVDGKHQANGKKKGGDMGAKGNKKPRR